MKSCIEIVNNINAADFVGTYSRIPDHAMLVLKFKLSVPTYVGVGQSRGNSGVCGRAARY